MAEYVCEIVTEHELCGDVHHYVRHELVVRCRDCAFSHDGGNTCRWFYGAKVGAAAMVEPDGFCAWGKPREEA